MSSVSFYLKSKKSNNCRVYLKLTDRDNVDIRLSTGVSVKPRHWSKKKGVLSPDAMAISKNKTLADFANKVMEVYSTAINKGIRPNAEFIKSQLDATETAKEHYRKFWQIWEQYIRSKQNRVGALTFEKLNSLKFHLENFEHYSGMPWDLELISTSRLQDFDTYLLNASGYYHSAYRANKKEFNRDAVKVENVPMGVNNQTTKKYFGFLKMFLNWCKDEGYTVNEAYKKHKSVSFIKPPRVAMSDQDLAKIRLADLTGKNYLQNVRSLFLISCFTALRYSDYSRINKSHLKYENDTPFLVIFQQKVKKQIRIPLTKEIENLVIDLIEGNVHPVTNQRMNMYLKELCQIAGIDEPMEVTEQKAGITVSTTKPKFELITSHTGRRTCATNLMLKGVPVKTICSITGHASEKQLFDYIHVPDKLSDEILIRAING